MAVVTISLKDSENGFLLSLNSDEAVVQGSETEAQQMAMFMVGALQELMANRPQKARIGGQQHTLTVVENGWPTERAIR